MKSPLNPVPWTNKIGQVIRPGDKVLVITKGYCSSVHIRQGTFAGTTDGLGSAIVDFECYSWKDNVYTPGHRTRRTTPPLQRIYALA
jgi:hypothetical protein